MEYIPDFKSDNMILQKAGKTHYFSIPKAFINSNLLSIEKLYDLRIFGKKLVLLNNRKIQTHNNGKVMRTYISIPIENIDNGTLKHKEKYTIYFS